jgi:chemotaxis protein histidine kinase CheA
MTELVKIESTQLEKVVNESGLKIQEGEQIKQSYLPFLNQLADIQSQSIKINFESPSRIDEEIASRLRKDTVKVRTGAEALKDSRKKIHLLKGNLEQAAYNLIAASCKLTEETFLNVEKAREIAEKKRKELLKAERIETLLQYNVDGQFLNLGEMTNEVWDAFLLGQKTAFEAKLAAEKKAEEDRIAKEKADAAERERMRIENENLKKEAEAKEKQLLFERKKAEELANKEREKAAKLLADQKAKAEEERKKLEEANKIEREKQAAILKKQQEEAAKVQAELQAKKEAEAKEAKRIADEKAAKELTEKKAAMAPDKDKLRAWVNSLPLIDITLSTNNAKLIEEEIRRKMAGFKSWCNSQIDTL